VKTKEITPLFSKGFITALLLMCLVASCKDDDTPDNVDCTGLTPTYTSDIKAILDASCAKSGCHNSADLANNMDLSTYANAMAISQQPRFLGAINHQSGFIAMPQDGPKLSNDKIELLTCWVENGSPE
jgi:hypothetical protein